MTPPVDEMSLPVDDDDDAVVDWRWCDVDWIEIVCCFVCNCCCDEVCCCWIGLFGEIMITSWMVVASPNCAGVTTIVLPLLPTTVAAPLTWFVPLTVRMVGADSNGVNVIDDCDDGNETDVSLEVATLIFSDHLLFKISLIFFWRLRFSFQSLFFRCIFFLNYLRISLLVRRRHL